jgi:hypothetical protein
LWGVGGVAGGEEGGGLTYMTMGWMDVLVGMVFYKAADGVLTLLSS